MKKLVAIAAALSLSANAEVTALGDVLGGLDASEMSSFNDTLSSTDSFITEDLDIGIDIATVNQAVSEGFITEEQAGDVETALNLVQENAEFFDFDFAQFLAGALADENISIADLTGTMEVFNGLTPAQKIVVGQEGFSPYTSVSCTGGSSNPDCTLTVNPQLTSATFDSASRAAVLGAPLSPTEATFEAGYVTCLDGGGSQASCGSVSQ